jgi:hypothetical protein
MWTAYIFAGLALVSLPAAIASGNLLVIVAWTAQTFLQLVLLPILLVGSDAQSRRIEAIIIDTHQLAVAEHEQTRELVAELHQRLSG